MAFCVEFPWIFNKWFNSYNLYHHFCTYFIFYRLDRKFSSHSENILNVCVCVWQWATSLFLFYFFIVQFSCRNKFHFLVLCLAVRCAFPWEETVFVYLREKHRLGWGKLRNVKKINSKIYRKYYEMNAEEGWKIVFIFYVVATTSFLWISGLPLIIILCKLQSSTL